MTARFAERVEQYVAMRRGLGYRLDRQATYLRSFAAFLDRCGTTVRFRSRSACSGRRIPARRTRTIPRTVLGRCAMRAPTIAFPALLQDFFLQRLIEQRGVSARTVESYRDAFELLLCFAERRTGKRASALSLEDLDAPLVLDFLDHLEHERGNSARTRNARLAAIRSFMSYASVRDPTSLPIAQRVLAIPPKRFDQPVLGYLSREEILVDRPSRSDPERTGRRDRRHLKVLRAPGTSGATPRCSSW
jgi:hypothetical protein